MHIWHLLSTSVINLALQELTATALNHIDHIMCLPSCCGSYPKQHSPILVYGYKTSTVKSSRLARTFIMDTRIIFSVYI